LSPTPWLSESEIKPCILESWDFEDSEEFRKWAIARIDFGKHLAFYRGGKKSKNPD